MLINLEIWRSQSLWNEFRITYFKALYKFKFSFTLETSKLGIFRISEERLRRLELMIELNTIGFSSREISGFLNVNGIKTVRTDNKYTPKLVWVSLKKFKTRLERFKKDKLLKKKEEVEVTKYF